MTRQSSFFAMTDVARKMDPRVKPGGDDCAYWQVRWSIQPPRLFRQHDRDAVADRVGELGGTRDQLLLLGVVFKRALGQRADQDFQELRIDAAGGTFGGRGGHG